jgi:hypothetical protein
MRPRLLEPILTTVPLSAVAEAETARTAAAASAPAAIANDLR